MYLRQQGRGFTLIELMIVIAIIAIIAAVAIPNLLRSRAAANETRVIANLRTWYSDTIIDSSSLTGFWTNGGYAYTGDVQSSWVSFDAVLFAGDYDWGVLAVPEQPEATGFKSFWIDNRGVVRSNAANYSAFDTDTWAASTTDAID